MSSYDYNELYQVESEGVAAEIEAKQKTDEVDQITSTIISQSNLKGDTQQSFNQLLAHESSMNRVEIARTTSRNYSKMQEINYTKSISTVTKQIGIKQRNVTTRGIYNTFVPTSDYQELCNYNTCQLGKCLPNGKCECVKPAVGRFCDKIDECLVLKCIHVSYYSKIFLFKNKSTRNKRQDYK